MAFVKEKIPEEYWGMLKELGVFDEYTRLKSWVADKDREIFFWYTKLASRDDDTTSYILLWEKHVVFLNTTVVDNSKLPTWDDNHEHLQKGLIQKEVNHIKIPQSLASRGKELIQIIREAFQNSDYRYDVELTYIATPEVREDK
ncbi:hypothetical protein [Streptococcus dentiloxodontae]